MEARKQDTPYGLRMPKGMRAEIRAMAEENGRSMNAEITFHLRVALGERAERKGEQAETHAKN
ncbi:Arc family DNA-binding protein [Neotabrizicola sp. sgz301269]|uniref:Arc family DNA-binding protein n=1 Tax=Neotabrizicola sp. sgz301269 TaxID=3276282 RepID=UPI00376F92A5